MVPETIVIPETLAPVPVFASKEAERRHRKERLAAALRLFADYGFDEGIAGHITVRDPEYADRFWVNPFGRYFGQIKVSDLICVDARGRVLEGEDRTLNLAAFAIHEAIHQARPEVQAVVHAHSLYGRIFSATGRMIQPLTLESTPFYEDHILFGAVGGVVSELAEGERLAQALGKKKAAILRNHGLLTVGESLEAAVWWFIALERACQTEILSAALGNPVVLMPAEAEKAYRQLGHDAAGRFQFQPLFQRTVARHPDLFE